VLAAVTSCFGALVQCASWCASSGIDDEFMVVYYQSMNREVRDTTPNTSTVFPIFQTLLPTCLSTYR